MKKKIVQVVLILSLILSTTLPGFAASRLATPYINIVEPAKNSIKIDWKAIKYADEYKIYRATSKNGTFKFIDYAEKSLYRDYNITKGKRYYYKVRAVTYGERSDSKLSGWRSGLVKKSAVSSSTSSSAQNSQTVYITNTGAKYHNSGCRSLKKSCIPIKLNDAKNRGYEPCKLCH